MSMSRVNSSAPRHVWLLAIGVAFLGLSCGDDRSSASAGTLKSLPAQPVAGEVFELTFPGDLVSTGEWVLTFTEGTEAGTVFVLTQGNGDVPPSVRESDGEYFVLGGAAMTQPGERVVKLLAPDASGPAMLCNSDETACDPIEIRR